MFLALTGLRLRTAGLYYCSLVTHTIPSERSPQRSGIENAHVQRREWVGGGDTGGAAVAS